ncbi:hypothetical protein LCGC14_0614070 [marine sediment metagenome]|uniref:Holin of 3TMs, for gene-transfer release n=1 Tax=marine sediment metagenome TaxID=412755 RepID=A0A0F9RR75_9ZZZZ
MLPLIPIAISLAAKFAPMILGKLFGSKAEDTAEKVVDLASAITGEGDPSKLVANLNLSPENTLRFQEATNTLTLQMAQEDSKRLAVVNATMQSESMSGSWMQRAWRPFNGFLFGLTIWCDYFLFQVLTAAFKIDMDISHVPMPVYLLWSTVLGVTAYTRGKEKIAKTGSLGSILNLFT